MTGPLFEYALRLGDDALILAQRLGEWISRAPELEEDVALANIALDLLGQARSLLSYAGQVEGAGRDEDALAYLREERQFRNVQLVELPNGDFAHTIARQLFFATYQLGLYQALATSKDATLAGVAGKAVKEVAYHADHATQWTLRLGDGTEESHRRMQEAVDRLWPYTHELFESDELVRGLAAEGVAVDPATLRPAWQERVTGVLAEATLAVPEDDWRPAGGRRGIHTEHLGYLLAEMQYLPRAYPGARW
ncbi:phenylacetate-CoA oxygenase subunit PaaI [Carbonactinospora thermoautotrophica]|uniref:1,2-phenylacetyl-CoA epoxidase subunit PaaC n=1 Tax=Carbonactinospora thermoautotrophica TaxID=1469144 RepID=UPI00226EA306|nr:1,2-phenylacetyl-CoA epoxidase subunit PaaC [Carbonactinospora thermoautotrophica]MCX9191616.1 phenylacetate-CoA oxygenase subunit PaaI [Carbonactinospora thermoautotrophica]